MASPYVVFMENQFVPTGREFFAQENENQAVGVFDPSKAKTFDTKAEARDWARRLIAPTIGLENLKIRRLCPIVKQVFRSWVEDGCIYRRLAEARDDLNIPYDAECHSPADVLKWRISHGLADENTVLYENYESWPELYLVFHHLDQVDVFVECDDSDLRISGTPEVRIGIRINPKTSKFKTFKKELESAKEAILEANPAQTANEFIWPIQYDENDGINSYVLVEDQVLSSGGNTTVYSVRAGGWNGLSEYPEIQTESLKKVFEYIKKNYPHSIDIGPDTESVKSSSQVKRKKKIGP